MAHPSLAQRPSGDLAAPDRLSPSRRLLWDTLESSMRERWEHSRLPDLHPTEVREAMLAPTRPMVGAHETMAKFRGPPLEQPWVGMSSTVDPGKVIVRRRDDVEATLVERVDHGNGTWSRRRQDGAAIGELRWMGPVLYEFQGQSRYSTRPRSSGWRWEEADRGREDISNRGQILGSIRTDANGGKWQAVDIDEQAIAALLVAYDRAMGAEEPEEAEEADQMEDIQEEDGWSRSLSRWTEDTCEDGTECYVLDGEDKRERTEHYPTERQKALATIAVNVVSSSPADYHPTCGGVFLTPWTILTAAHCIFGDHDDGEDLESSQIRVCTQGNSNLFSRCSRISATIDVPGKYLSKRKARHDYALIHATSAADDFIDSHTEMYMSKARDRWVESFSMHNVASPTHAPKPASSSTNSCSKNTTSPAGEDPYRIVDNGAWLVHQQGEIKAKSRAFKQFFTFCQTHSGSPIYYCGDSRCDTGENGKVVSLVASWSGRSKGFRGPKVRRFRTWALVRLTF